MAKYLTRQRKRLLEYLSEHTDEQISARQIAEDLEADQISISAVYRNISAWRKKDFSNAACGKGQGKSFTSILRQKHAKTACTWPAASAERVFI